MNHSEKDIREQMKKSKKYFEEICGKAVQVIVVGILAYLSYWSAVSTFRYPLDYSSKQVLQYADSPIQNLLAAGAVVLMFYLFRCLLFGKKKEGMRKKVSLIALIDVLIVGIVLCIWVTVSKLAPTSDPYMVYVAVENFRRGDYSVIQSFHYYQLNSHQFGLILLEELLTLIWQSYRIIQYVNVVYICMILYFLYLITDLLFQDPVVDLYCLMGATAFLPMHLYVTYVYGDICSIALILVVVWCLLKWDVDPKRRYMVLAVGCALIALLARKNTLIPLTAVMIVCLFLAWKKWSWKPLLFGALLLVVSLSAHRGARAFYEYRSGMEISEGLPAVVWIAMGMQGEWGAHGVWNGFTDHTWGRFVGEEDAQEKQRDFALSSIKESIEEFNRNPQEARLFYHYKILEQWAEPSYSSLMMNGDSATGKGGVTEWFYLGVVPDLICRFDNYFQFCLYFLSLCGLIDELCHRASIKNQVLLIAIIGGFLFSVLWEARAKYVLPSAVMFLPYMARGAWALQNAMGWIAKHLKSGIEEKLTITSDNQG